MKNGGKMIEIKETELPYYCVNCDSCSSYDDIKSILIYQPFYLKGSGKTITGKILELHLCGKCRIEMGERLKE